MTIKLDVKTVLAIVSAILAGGIWLGVLQQRVTSLEWHDTYYHGTLQKGP